MQAHCCFHAAAYLHCHWLPELTVAGAACSLQGYEIQLADVADMDDVSRTCRLAAAALAVGRPAGSNAAAAVWLADRGWSGGATAAAVLEQAAFSFTRRFWCWCMQEPSSQAKQPVEFDQAINYVNKIKVCCLVLAAVGFKPCYGGSRHAISGNSPPASRLCSADRVSFGSSRSQETNCTCQHSPPQQQQQPAKPPIPDSGSAYQPGCHSNSMGFVCVCRAALPTMSVCTKPSWRSSTCTVRAKSQSHRCTMR